KLRARHVKARDKNGVILSYIEGWHAIAEANRIFGFDGWSRETIETNCIWDAPWQNRRACSYTARVRIRVLAGHHEIIREGSGSGHGFADTAGEAHESALKEAETDATKRALTTFGNPFGLALYDKEQRGVTRSLTGGAAKTKPNKTLWELFDQERHLQSQHTDPVDYCANFRRLLENAAAPTTLKALWDRNQNTLLILKANCPDLTSEKGHHYADILARLFATRLDAFASPANKDDRHDLDNSTVNPQEATSPLTVSKRIHNKDHLKYVASQPCLICGRENVEAHHILFAEPRAMGKKVGDQWTVPLCAIHHRSLHMAGNEEPGG
ncbi:MAG: RAD52 family DNA repair protein, partial [Proteobacteria bacterium]|nr:RAD52 family DNA repair protein [Pseudomonadota bacterium]